MQQCCTRCKCNAQMEIAIATCRRERGMQNAHANANTRSQRPHANRKRNLQIRMQRTEAIQKREVRVRNVKRRTTHGKLHVSHTSSSGWRAICHEQPIQWRQKTLTKTQDTTQYPRRPTTSSIPTSYMKTSANDFQEPSKTLNAITCW